MVNKLSHLPSKQKYSERYRAGVFSFYCCIHSPVSVSSGQKETNGTGDGSQMMIEWKVQANP